MHSFTYILAETWISMKKSATMLFSAAVIMTTALSLLGFFIVTQNFFKVVLKDIENNLQIVVFLEDGFNERTLKDAIIPSVRAYPEVAEVEYVNKEKAREELKKDIAELDEIFSIIEDNPLPSSLRIKVRTPQSLKTVAERLKKENGIIINEITYGGENVHNFLTASEKFKQFSVIFLALFILTSVIVTAATIKLTIYSRRSDIEIMKLVGATDWYVKWPYIIEGMALGLISSAFAIMLVLFLKNSAVLEIAKSIQFLSGFKSEVSMLEIGWKLTVVGILQGIIGALWSTSSILSEKE
ncbi:MAG: Cell division protein FtsX [bacterium ADurb.Bin243]|nr:MAG: Cell division protein FtsX [bacterium ADurb.Bin243]HOD41275.1 permease-like cell division protein FtsX [Candidatus Wallbacteria bacterium]